MKKVYLALAASVVTSAIMVGGLAGTAFAWHPKAEIIKEVQNVTANSALADANTEAAAVAAKPGDTIKYVITVKNSAKPASNEWNDLWYTVMGDTLPAGVELVSDPAKRTITENIGVLKPGESKKFEYTLKVTKQQDGSVKNTACVDGDSKVKDNKQHDCDDAVIKVKKPEVPPQEPPKEEPKVTPPAPEILPVTGAGSVLGIFAGVSGLGYGLHRVATRLKRQ